MSRSAALRLLDLRVIHTLIGECRELGDDAAGWHQHLYARLARFTGGGVVMGGEVAGLKTGRIEVVGPADWGWENGFERNAWETATAEAHRGPHNCRLVTFPTYMTRTAINGMCLARTDLISDAEWDHLWEFRHVQEPAGADHSLYCALSIPALSDRHMVVIIARALRDADFSTRQKAIVQETMAECTRLVGGPLARFSEPSPADLSPLARRVLRCFLEGDSDKLAAARLGLTRNTVNGYAKMIHRHFGVRSRAELLARWVRRGWGARFAWADET
jgi:DNA-binding CsgD family transcriptional regulator